MSLPEIVFTSIGLPRAQAAAQGEIIDRVLAVVSGEIITQSDVEGAIALRLVPLCGAQGVRIVALQRLIERVLILREVRRLESHEPDEAVIDQELQAIRLTFTSDRTFLDALALAGLNERKLRDYVRDDTLIALYVQERFGGVAMLPNWRVCHWRS